MGFFDKLMFWKKDDDFSLDSLDTNFTTPDPNSFGASPPTGQQQYGAQPPSHATPSYGSGHQDSFAPSSFDSGSSQNFEFSAMNERPHKSSSSYPSENVASKDMEVISSKLDAIRAMLDSINSRLANVERVALHEEAESRKRHRGY